MQSVHIKKKPFLGVDDLSGFVELWEEKKSAGLTSGLYGGCGKVETPSQGGHNEEGCLERCCGGIFSDRQFPVIPV